MHGRSLERAVLWVIVVTGISSVATQIITIREFLSQFQGNEIVISLILFNWLMLGGMGTFASHYVSRVLRPTPGHLAFLSIILASMAVVQIPVIRLLRDEFFITGSSVGFYPTWIFTMLTIMPYCTLLGFVLPYSLFVLRKTIPAYPGARVYIFDNIGDIGGGLLFSAALVFLVTPVKAVIIANLPLFISSIMLAGVACRYGESRIFLSVVPALVLAAVAAVWSFREEIPTLTPVGGAIVHYMESKFGRIMISGDHGQFTLVQDGIPVFSNENRELAEESVHYLFSQLDSVRTVLAISAQGGMIREIRKYPVERIDYVELDPEVSDSVFKYGMLEKTPLINVIHQDGRAWLKDTQMLYDAIIINLPEPDTFQINRFYTLEFFQLARSHLSPGGGLGFSVEGYDSYLGGPELEKISSLYNTAARCFKNVLLLPGFRVFFICSSAPLSRDIPALLNERGITTAYIGSYFYGNLTEERINGLNNAIDPQAPLNTDLRPRLIKIMFQQWFCRYGSSPYIFTAVLLIVTGLYVSRLRRNEFVIFSTGAMIMGAETLVIFTFQVFYGYIYFLIGVIVTVFLAGLLPGAVLSQRIQEEYGSALLRYTDLGLMGLMLIFMAWMEFGAGGAAPLWCFLAFGFAISMLCGLQFPAVLKLQGDSNSSAAHVFSADIAGAGIGSLLISLVLIPWGGLLLAGTGLVFIKVLSSIALWRSWK